MGFLKKIQDANPDDGNSEVLPESIDFEPEPDPDPVSPVPPPAPREDQSRDKQPGDQEERDSSTKEEKKDGNADTAAGPEAEVIPAEVVKLELMLRGHDWWSDYSDDAGVRAEGSRSLGKIHDQLKVCASSGHLEDAHKVWEKYAPKEYPVPNIFFNKQYDPAIDATRGPSSSGGLPARRLGEPFSEPYNRRLFAQSMKMPAPSPVQQPSSQDNDQPQNQGYGGSSVPTSLLVKALTAPFAVTAAAGSLIVSGLKFAGDKARGFYVKGRENGHAILGRQLDEAADSIVGMTQALKSQGMGDIIADMRATGRPARELFQGMAPGGPHQHFSDRFSVLMKNEQFAQQYAKLEDALSDFGFKSSHYAQTGIELNRDYSDAIERNVEKISAATEGFIFKKDGAIKHLQELARSISETISNMINNLLGRHKPQ